VLDKRADRAHGRLAALFRPRTAGGLVYMPLTAAKRTHTHGRQEGRSGEKVLYCSFCGKSQHEVKKLIAGPSVFICDECIELCNDIIRDEVPADTAGPRRPSRDLPVPSEIKPASTST
jgi:hypothetical protein